MKDQTILGTGGHLTIRQLAQKLNIHCESARRWLRKKRLKGIKVGAHWRIPAEELARVEKGGGI
jgi:excisionase family DNA binding protein